MQEGDYLKLGVFEARIWELLPPRCETVDSLCARLRETFPDHSSIRDELVHKRLVQ